MDDKTNLSICQNRHARKNEMLIIRRAHWYLHNGQAYRSIKGREQHVRAKPAITDNKTHRCLMIIHTHTQHSSYFACCQHYSFGLPPPNVSLRLRKRTEHIFFPQQLQLGKISLGIWNWISCIICIHVLSLENPLNLQQAVFICSGEGGGGVWVSLVTKQLERESEPPTPLSSFISSPPPTPAVCQLFHYTAS